MHVRKMIHQQWGGVREIKGKLGYKAEAGAAIVSLFRVMLHNNATAYWIRVFEIK